MGFLRFLNKKKYDQRYPVAGNTIVETIEKHEIPPEKITEVLELVDKIANLQNSGCGSQVARHALWSKIQKALPGVEITGQNWTLSTTEVLAPYIYKNETPGAIKIV